MIVKERLFGGQLAGGGRGKREGVESEYVRSTLYTYI
jgi:hypothetical protein